MDGNDYELIILGGGCAGLAAAIYAGRARLRTLLIENGRPGGQILTTNQVENYPGVPTATGADLALQMLEQARSFGVEPRSCRAESVRLDGEMKEVVTDAGTFRARCVILATGAEPRRLGFAGEEEFRGRGVSYCAACDGFFFKGREVLAVGGGNSAAEESLFLTRFAKKITLLVRSDALRCDGILRERLAAEPKLELRFRTELVRVRGEGTVTTAVLRDARTGEERDYVPAGGGPLGVFVFVGYAPSSELFRGLLELDGDGYIKTDETLRTAIPGVFAAGDVRRKPLRQIVTAAADGAVAAMQAESYIQREGR